MNNKDKKNEEYQTLVKLNRPRTLNLETQTIDVNINETVEVIDLCTPNIDINDISIVPVVLQNTSISNIMIERFPNIQRLLSILPWFPTNNTQNQGYPLLANIPPHQLTPQELVRRRADTFKPAFNIINYDSTIPSFLREKYQMFFGDLLERLKVDMTILDYNYTRLNQYLKMLVYEQIRVLHLRLHEIQRIDEKEYPLALEFFLQFDVNMFYMKTCSFRYARPRTLNEGLFCIREPEARYELAACGNCGLCYPQYDMKYRSKKSIIEFSQAHKHTFLNGYQTILNCSASCHTRNIIYALTCPCGKYDYIGATTQSLHDRLRKHREHGNRIIHEFLLGQENIKRNLLRDKSNEVLAKDRMKLYQHSVRCPVAMQIFLDANPQYWRFVPMTLEESERPEQQIITSYTFTEEFNWNIRSKEDTKIYVEAVPKPPKRLTFSNRQILLQTQYFHKTRDRALPNQDIDLYNATIVAVLPETCSDMFRFTIESLFITYAETNLNSIGNVLNTNQNGDHYPMNDPWLIRGNEWCHGLLRRPQPKTILSTDIVATK
ncbi:unnamed protein product [Rotaria sordida]|uniref:GIY-YIG domain-containing protein n=1 Tax=Rotaria sordida TaxID=392033 RepID=A0A816DD54_9BILA|nr:unnamed protein product [Rotaria sordida]CAF1634450.1 unnamed protein product [Rotaria sordida]